MSGVLARCGPLSLLAASMLLLAGGLSLSGLRSGLVAFGVQLLVVVLLVGRGGRIPWWRLLPGVLAFGSVAWSNWLLASPRAVDAAVVAGLRVAYFVVPGIVFA
ncbi:MAG: energy-coupling factor transporter transmembrane protein EcfT, partial [Austwickia sp.]|nr:energy-coupling factor transporter transmembrane protein EcfT [Austwickia sp.]